MSKNNWTVGLTSVRLVKFQHRIPLIPIGRHVERTHLDAGAGVVEVAHDGLVFAKNARLTGSVATADEESLVCCVALSSLSSRIQSAPLKIKPAQVAPRRFRMSLSYQTMGARTLSASRRGVCSWTGQRSHQLHRDHRLGSSSQQQDRYRPNHQRPRRCQRIACRRVRKS